MNFLLFFILCWYKWLLDTTSTIVTALSRWPAHKKKYVYKKTTHFFSETKSSPQNFLSNSKWISWKKFEFISTYMSNEIIWKNKFSIRIFCCILYRMVKIIDWHHIVTYHSHFDIGFIIKYLHITFERDTTFFYSFFLLFFGHHTEKKASDYIIIFNFQVWREYLFRVRNFPWKTMVCKPISRYFLYWWISFCFLVHLYKKQFFFASAQLL